MIGCYVFNIMSWRECVRRWFCGRIETGGVLSITDLLGELVEHRIVPSDLIGNRYLHYILLTQMTVEILDSVYVPPMAAEGLSFVYHMSSKDMLLDEMRRKNAERIQILLNETGVDLNHFHKLWGGGLNIPINDKFLTEVISSDIVLPTPQEEDSAESDGEDVIDGTPQLSEFLSSGFVNALSESHNFN